MFGKGTAEERLLYKRGERENCSGRQDAERGDVLILLMLMFYIKI